MTYEDELFEPFFLVFAINNLHFCRLRIRRSTAVRYSVVRGREDLTGADTRRRGTRRGCIQVILYFEAPDGGWCTHLFAYQWWYPVS